VKPPGRASTVLGWAVLVVLGLQGLRVLADLRGSLAETRRRERGRALAASLDERWRDRLGPAFEPFVAVRELVPPDGRVFVAFRRGTKGTIETHELLVGLYPISILLAPTGKQAGGGFALDGSGGRPGPGDFMLELDDALAEGAFPELESVSEGERYTLFRVRGERTP